jgi:hypothetical protein
MSRTRTAASDPTAQTYLGFEKIDQLLDALTNIGLREASMIALRYGIDDGQPKTLREIGYIYGVSRKRVAEIISRGIADLRNPPTIPPHWRAGQNFYSFTILADNRDWCLHCRKVALVPKNESNGARAGRARRYCSDACRQAAYRTRKALADGTQ